MQHSPIESGDLSQAQGAESPHPSPVAKLQREVAVDPIARASRRAFTGLQDSAVGLEFGVSVVIALAFGVWLDGQAGTNPLFMFLCLAIGLAAGFRGIYRAVRRADNQAKEAAADG
jgi:ATP synthase protein I